MQSEPQDATIGAVFDGRYRIDALLGRGGMGAVYRAHQLAVGRDVAIKVLHPALSADASTMERFENEARVIAGLRHPNTIKLVDVGRLEDARIFIVTELVEGQTLDGLLTEGLSLEDGIGILVQVCDALTEAHDRGVVHRDLKPGNVMVEQIGAQNVAKVLDFGIAKLAANPKVTATGTIFGTPAYMSPEQAKGVPVDARTDIYALGIILYQLVCGRLPFESTSPGALMVRHITEEPTPPSDLMAGTDRRLPPALEDLILQMLEKDPEDRPRTMDDVRRRLGDPGLLLPAEGTPPVAAPDRPTDDWAPPIQALGYATAPEDEIAAQAFPPRRRGVGLAVAALVLGLGSWLAWDRYGASPGVDAEAIAPEAPAAAEPAPEPEPEPAETEPPPAEATAVEAAPSAADPSPTPEPNQKTIGDSSPSRTTRRREAAGPGRSRPSARPRRPSESAAGAKPTRSPPAKASEKESTPSPSTPVPPGLQDVEL